MHTWFLVKIRYEKVMENGMNKKVTEPYLVDALSFTEAEARAIEEVSPFISGEFTIADIKRAHYSELFTSEEESADKWYDCKLEFITLDEKSGAEKKTKTTVLVQAADLRDAMKKLDEGMKGTMADYNAVCIKETAIMDVYPYEAKEGDKDRISVSLEFGTDTLSEAARIVKRTSYENGAIGTLPLTCLDYRFNNNGIAIIKELAKLGVVSIGKKLIKVTDKELSSFKWYEEKKIKEENDIRGDD